MARHVVEQVLKKNRIMKKIEELIKESTPTLLVLTHDGKQDSGEVTHLIDEIRNHYREAINILTLDTTHDGKMSERYHVKDYPTYILFKEGEELMRESGRKTIGQLDDMVKRAY